MHFENISNKITKSSTKGYCFIMLGIRVSPTMKKPSKYKPSATMNSHLPASPLKTKDKTQINIYKMPLNSYKNLSICHLSMKC